jgi:hypothetical protein
MIGACWAVGSWTDSWVTGSWADGPPPLVQTGSARQNRKGQWWLEIQERATIEAERYDAMKSQMLQAQLELERQEKAKLAREQQILKQHNQQLNDVLGEMKNQASAMAAQGSSIYNQINTLTQPMDALTLQRKEQQLANLEKAREAREAKKREEEEKRKKMLKNLAKARKAKGK